MLQSDINIVKTWTDMWLVRLNEKKCKVIHFGKKNTNANYIIADNESMTETVLETSECERDLGVLISNDLKHANQCHKAPSTAHYIISLMSRTFVSRSPVLWKLIYTTYIRPLVEFAIQVWSPYLRP